MNNFQGILLTSTACDANHERGWDQWETSITKFKISYNILFS